MSRALSQVLVGLKTPGTVIYLGVLLGARARVSRGNLVQLPFHAKGFDAAFGLVRLAGRTEPLMLSTLRQLASEVLVDAHCAPSPA